MLSWGMGATRYLPHYTVEDYLQWEGDWELWDGVPVAMSPSPKWVHQDAAGRLFRQIGNSLDGEQCGDCHAAYEIDWHVRENQVVRPDILVVCDVVPED